jgi:hypothetical protein
MAIIKSEKLSKEPLLADDSPISNRKTLGVSIHILLNPETKEVEAIISDDPFGVSEYDKDAKVWVPSHPEDTWRITGLFNDSIDYVVDWSNKNGFDENNKSLALIKYSDDTLDEQWLEENTILANYPSVGKLQ